MKKGKSRYNKLLSIEKIIDDVVENLVDKKKSPLMKIELAWENTLEPTIKKNCQPEKFRRGMLTVKCTNSIWKSEMFFFKEEIIRKINRELGEELVKDIFFV